MLSDDGFQADAFHEVVSSSVVRSGARLDDIWHFSFVFEPLRHVTDRRLVQVPVPSEEAVLRM